MPINIDRNLAIIHLIMGKHTFDIDKCCTHLRQNGLPKSIGKCATYVKNAM